MEVFCPYTVTAWFLTGVEGWGWREREGYSCGYNCVRPSQLQVTSSVSAPAAPFLIHCLWSHLVPPQHKLKVASVNEKLCTVC